VTVSVAICCIFPPLLVVYGIRVVVDGKRVVKLGPMPSLLSAAAATANTVTTSSSSASVVVGVDTVLVVICPSISVIPTAVVVTTFGVDEDDGIAVIVFVVCSESSVPTVDVLVLSTYLQA